MCRQCHSFVTDGIIQFLDDTKPTQPAFLFPEILCVNGEHFIRDFSTQRSYNLCDENGQLLTE